ncbi:hypothetical protein AC1031_009652 [Aphanomyces cochlioides]|nr:hypothetical protein AC1031_009652 [Aphanomyces cochlioides]
MKASVFFLSTLSTSALARMAYSALSVDEQANVKSQLSKWKTLFAPIAKEHGYLPQSSTESATLVDTHSDEELARFHNTLQDVAKAQKNNPQAHFSPFNVFALLTPAEFNKIMQNSYAGQNLTAATPLTEDATASDASVDWSTHKCSSPVKNQGQCGSCWAFSTIGTTEFAHCLATGELLDLSEQQVVNCETNSKGCIGGYTLKALDFERQGVCTEESFPYTSGSSGQAGSCQSSCEKKKLTVGETGHTTGEASLVTVLNSQPATVAVSSSNEVWRNYKSGVVTQCPDGPLDHAVIAVGYDKTSIKIKNSWGAQWGDNGYIYLQRGGGGDKGMCGVAQDIVYPKVTKAAASSPSMSKGIASKSISTGSAPTYVQSNQWLQRHAGHGGNNQGYQPNSPNHGNRPSHQNNFPRPTFPLNRPPRPTFPHNPHSRPPCSKSPSPTTPFTDTPSTDSPFPTDSPSDSPFPTDSPSDSPYPTDSPSDSPFPTDSPSDSPTDSPSDSPYPTDSPSDSPFPTDSPSDSPFPTDSPSDSPFPTDSPSDSPFPTDSPSDSPTDSPSDSPYPTDSPSDSPFPTDSPSDSPFPTDSPSDSPFPTDSPSDSPFPTDSPSTDSPSTDVPSTYSPPTDAPSSSISPPTPAPSTP